MKWWVGLAALLAIGLAVWLARPALRPEPPKLGEYAIEERPRAPGQSARDVEPENRPSEAPRVEMRPGVSPSPSLRPVHVTPGQLHLRDLVPPPPKSPSERFIKRRPPSTSPYRKRPTQ